MFDVVVRGGRVVDPSQELDRVADVGIRGGRIAAIAPDLLSQGVHGDVVDARGLLVTPGWVDLHTHVFWGGAPLGIEPDPHCLRRGVTTAVDAGSAGASTFPAFKRYVIDVSATRIVAMLNLSIVGMATDQGASADAFGELEDIRLARVDRAVEVARDYADVVTGIKVRLSVANTGPDPERVREALRRARQAADAIGKPVMVHVGLSAIPLDEILSALVRGDIVTHVYHGNAEGVLDDAGRVRASVRAAAERGVNFDVGHGRGSFSWRVARAGLAQGLLPGTISSDIHVWNIAGPVFDLATTASKLLHLGMTLPEVIRRVTTTPAACIGMAGVVGTLARGALADVSVFRLASGEWVFRDSGLEPETGSTRLEPVAAVHGGRVVACAPAVY
ncbi:MAG: amidohydrolase/deacetylase family metallohydrolase [Chloroflexi bacterium]|nr:amidohydrolase/deacetylase family metallohydrolase [Chloroflexota bacterium]